MNEAFETHRRQGRPVGILIEWLRKEWEDGEPSKASSRTTQSMWELAGELLRVKRELVMVFAKVSGNDPREVLETLRDMEASNHRMEEPETEE